ncbi:family 10 glycosylhydrolase [Myxosarcina sp. GI1(2024)]
MAKVAIAVSLFASLGTTKSARAAVEPYCQFNPEEIATKEKLLRAALENDSQADNEYRALVREHGLMLQQCRSQNWPEEQAIWLRLYPCDVSPGSIDYVLDRIVNLGYNQVHLEVFYDGQVLLPPADNPTPWIPVVRSPGAENLDLLKQTIDKGRQRGLKVYAWLFTMNFGYTYAQRPDRQDALARNGQGNDSLTFVHDRSQAYIDPYSPQAQADYQNLVEAVLRRQPDGILFDYIRYPRGIDQYSAVNSVRNLWIYGKASLQTMFDRAKNQKGRAAIEKYITSGTITVSDIQEIDRQYPDEKFANWQSRKVISDESKLSLKERQRLLQSDLWLFSVAHAAQGILDFLSFATAPARERGFPAGAVFFPDANQIVGRSGFDSRLQAWDKFPAFLEWHPMAYAVCEGTDCIVNQVKTVLQTASPETKVTPALAGAWGTTYRKHPPLEAQMGALRQSTPEINSVSHFAYSWQEPDIDRQRKFCDLQ